METVTAILSIIFAFGILLTWVLVKTIMIEEDNEDI